MKTSLTLDDRVFEDAKKESHQTGKTLSEIISTWASLGRLVWKQQKHPPTSTFKPLELGSLKIDLNNRSEWMDELDDRT